MIFGLLGGAMVVSFNHQADRKPSPRHPHYLAVAPALGGFLSVARSGERLRWRHPPGPLRGRSRRPSGGARGAAAVVKGVTGKKALRCEGGIVRDVLRAICEVIGAFERSEGARYLKMGRFMAKDRFLQAICGGHIAVAVLVRYQLQSDASGDDPGLLEGWALAGEKAEAAWS